MLDDVVVTPDERHAFRGLLLRPDLPIDFAKIRLELRFIRNLPVPEELLVCSAFSTHNVLIKLTYCTYYCIS